MKHNKLLTLSLLASFLILISASFSYAANSVTYGSADVCPMPAHAVVYVPVTVGNDVDLAALDIVGKTVTISGTVAVKVLSVSFDNRMSDVNVLDTRYPIDEAVGGEFRFGAVKVAGADLAVGSGRIATLECEFVSNCKLGSAGIEPATANFCGTDVSTAFVSAAAAAITPTINSGAINVVNQAPTITFCPGDFDIFWNGGSVSVQLTADDPDLGCGCDALTFSMVSGIGQITAAGKYTYTGNRDDIGCNTVVVKVEDAFGASATCEFDVNVLNKPPVFSGFTAGTETIECGDTVFTTWDLNFHVFPIVTDPDLGPQALTYTLLGWTGGGAAPTIDINTGELSWAPPFDVNYWGSHTVTVKVSDGAPIDACNLQNADTCAFILHVVGFQVSVEKVHKALQGHDVDVSVYLDSAMMGAWTYTQDFIGGFDILLSYDASALTFMTAAKGALLNEFDWEYFTYRYGPQGNCGNACPSGMLRLVGLAETNNGAHHPGTINHPGELATLTFRVTTDANFNCMYAPIGFYWFDCGDNALSDVSGRFLYVGDSVFFFEGNPIADDNNPYGYDGAEPNCWDTLLIDAQPGYVKTYPLRALMFRNGGIDIECADSIDARGDVNLNGFGYEIADAVMYTNYFIEGLSAFGNPMTDPMRIEAAIAASDVNADGIKLSVADLVYLIRVITGDAQPYAKLVAGGDMTLSSQVMNEELTVRYTSGIDAGAALLVFDINGTVGTPRVGNGALGMDIKSSVVGNELRVLVFNIGSSAISAGIDNVLMTIPVTGSITLRDVEVADFFGATMNVSTRELPSRYDVAQNYPNPFNPTTTIALSLPVAGDYQLAIYNVAGQLIRTFDGSASAGVVSIVWDGKDASGSTVASGMYFYKATVGNFTTTKKMVLMK
jgi:hypothetical protein